MDGVGYEGTAEPAVELNEDVERPVFEAEKVHEPVQEEKIETAGVPADLSTEDLSLFTKLIIFAVIVAGCFGFVKSRSPRRSPAGRHGAYEKGGLP